MLVEVEDINDVPPRWSSTEWTVEVEEGQPASTILATFSVSDPDITNDLAFRVSTK